MQPPCGIGKAERPANLYCRSTAITENGVNNPLKHIRGALSMARDDDFDTAGTQFFVVHKDAAKLDGRYAAFGEMESGFDVLDAIANQPTYGPETWNKPKQMPVITKITIED